MYITIIPMKKITKLIAVVAVAGALTSFGTSCTPTQKGAATGAALGAGAGALIGSQSGNAGRGALIGAAAGGLGGALVGDGIDESRRPRW